MLQVQSDLPDVRLDPFIVRYVQRESNATDAELVEPVVARLGTMLEFLFADPYFIPALDGGSQVVIFILSFAVYGAANVAVSFPYWWGNPNPGQNNVQPDYCISRG